MDTYTEPYGVGEVVLATTDNLVIDFTCLEDDGTVNNLQKILGREEIESGFDYGEFKRRYHLVTGSRIIWNRAIMELDGEPLIAIDTFVGFNDRI